VETGGDERAAGGCACECTPECPECGSAPEAAGAGCQIQIIIHNAEGEVHLHVNGSPTIAKDPPVPQPPQPPAVRLNPRLGSSGPSALDGWKLQLGTSATQGSSVTGPSFTPPPTRRSR
jgi:hypothetical protein